MGFMADITRRIRHLFHGEQCRCDERAQAEKIRHSEHLRHHVVDAKLQELQCRLDYMNLEARQDFGIYDNGDRSSNDRGS